VILQSEAAYAARHRPTPADSGDIELFI